MQMKKCPTKQDLRKTAINILSFNSIASQLYVNSTLGEHLFTGQENGNVPAILEQTCHVFIEVHIRIIV